MRAWTAAVALSALLTLAPPVMAEEIASPIVGLWTYVSLTSKVVSTGEVRKPHGEHPGGYVLYTKSGRIMVVLIGDNRKAPAAPNPTDAERVELFKTLAAFYGTYKVEGNKAVAHVDRAWNQSWNGTDQVRNVEVSGNKLTLTWNTKSELDGQEVANTIIYERVE